MDLDSVEATKHMVELGLGICFLPRNGVSRELGNGTLNPGSGSRPICLGRSALSEATSGDLLGKCSSSPGDGIAIRG